MGASGRDPGASGILANRIMPTLRHEAGSPTPARQHGRSNKTVQDSGERPRFSANGIAEAAMARNP
jgi:hypothetical protein